MPKDMLEEENALFAYVEGQIHTFCLRLAFPCEHFYWEFEIVTYSHDIVAYIKRPQIV